MKQKLLIPTAAASLLLSLGFTSCQTAYPGQATNAGAGIGAVSGALIGGGAGGGRGALIGAGAGLLAGALVGAAVDSDQARYYHAPPGGYPYAQRAETPGYVYSPYGSHSLIDVRGVPQGARVRDTSTNGIFLNP